MMYRSVDRITSRAINRTIRQSQQITPKCWHQSITRSSSIISSHSQSTHRHFSQKTAKSVSDMNRSEIDQMISNKQSVNQSIDEQIAELYQLRAELAESIRQEEIEANRPITERVMMRLSTNQFGLKLLCFILGFVSLAGSLELVRLSHDNKQSVTDALIRYNQSSTSQSNYRAHLTELQTIDQYLLHQADNASLTQEQRDWIIQLRQSINQTIKQNSTDSFETSLRQRAAEIKQQLEAARKKQ